MTAQPLLQFGTVALDPAPDCRVVRFQAALAEQLFDIAERERIPKVPAHGAQNQLGLGLSPLKDRRSDCLLHDLFRLPAAVGQSCNTTPTQVAGNRAERQPPFIGDFEWNTPSIIDASDPSWFRSVTYVGRADRVLWDHVEQGWVTRNVFLFNVQYEGLKWLTEFQVHPDYGSREEARRQVDLYAPVLGRLPQALLSNTKEVEIQNEPTNRVSASANSTGIFHINTFQAADRLRIGLLEETLIHEGGHVSLQGHSRSAGWLAAQQADGVFITNYARDFPFREDVADSIEAYFAVKYRPDRISIEDRNAMLDAIPNRFAYFDGLQLDMSPFVLAVPW